MADANPADPDLAATMVDQQLQGVKANLLADQRQGMVGRGTFTLHPKIHVGVGHHGDGDGREMRAWLVISAAVTAAAVSALAGAEPAGANDPGGQDTYANAQASGGELTVQAGVTEWTPPAGSAWAKAAQSNPPPGRPNPNQPYPSAMDERSSGACSSADEAAWERGASTFPERGRKSR